SRRRHTRSKRDWSSDVCSSDLDKGKKIRLSNRGKLFYQRISTAINFDIYTPNTKSEQMIEKDVDDYNNLIQQTRLASVDSANPQIGRASCRERFKTSESERAY